MVRVGWWDDGCSELGQDFLRVVVAEIGCGTERFFAKEGGSEEVGRGRVFNFVAGGGVEATETTPSRRCRCRTQGDADRKKDNRIN